MACEGMRTELIVRAMPKTCIYSFIHSLIPTRFQPRFIRSYARLACLADSRHGVHSRRYVAPSHFILVYKNHLSPEACCFPLITIYINLLVHLDNDCTLKSML